MITDGTGKCQQTPELNKDQSRSTIGFLCSASCLKLFFIAVQIGEKDLVFCFCAFFRYMWGVCAFFFSFFFKVFFLIFFFFPFFKIFFIFLFLFLKEKHHPWWSTLISTLFDLVMKCTKCTVLLKREIKSDVSECLIKFSQFLTVFFFFLILFTFAFF